jgi:hypothetical protein
LRSCSSRWVSSARQWWAGVHLLASIGMRGGMTCSSTGPRVWLRFRSVAMLSGAARANPTNVFGSRSAERRIVEAREPNPTCPPRDGRGRHPAAFARARRRTCGDSSAPRRGLRSARAWRRRRRHSRARGPFTGQAVGGGLARVLGYSAGTETTLRITDLVWKVA